MIYLYEDDYFVSLNYTFTSQSLINPVTCNLKNEAHTWTIVQ
jgi:hypothetical protein